MRIATVLLCGAIAFGLDGCSTIKQAMPSQRQAQQHAEQLRQTQLQVMRFADEYAGGVREASSEFQRTAKGPEERLAAQAWKVQQSESAYTIASGPNSVANALDMVVLATLSRMVVEDLWTNELYRERAQRILDVHRRLEERAWKLTAPLLTDSQSARLKEVIEEWRKQNPNVRFVAYIHFNDFAKSVGAPRAGEERSSGNLFSMLGLDPFTSLDPAVREIAQTRELAERAIFYLQRAPGLLDMEIEKLTYAIAVMPETKGLLTNLDRVSLVGSAADRLSTSLPDILAHERQALISQLTQELDTHRETLSTLTGEVRSTLEAGTETANALRSTLEALDRISARYPPREKSAGANSPPPFDIRDYTEMIRELSATTRDLNTLAQNVDSALPAVHRATQDAAGTLQQITNRVFWQLLVLIVVAVVLTTLGALVYRVVVTRMQHRSASN